MCQINNEYYTTALRRIAVLLYSCQRKASPGLGFDMKSMFSKGLVYKNRAYFENSGPNWSKLGSFVDKHHIFM